LSGRCRVENGFDINLNFSPFMHIIEKSFRHLCFWYHYSTTTEIFTR
jgi:hypothetical protein